MYSIAVHMCSLICR